MRNATWSCATREEGVRVSWATDHVVLVQSASVAKRSIRAVRSFRSGSCCYCLLNGPFRAATLLVSIRIVLVERSTFAVRILPKTRFKVAMVDWRAMSTSVRTGLGLQLRCLLRATEFVRRPIRQLKRPGARGGVGKSSSSILYDNVIAGH